MKRPTPLDVEMARIAEACGDKISRDAALAHLAIGVHGFVGFGMSQANLCDLFVELVSQVYAGKAAADERDKEAGIVGAGTPIDKRLQGD